MDEFCFESEAFIRVGTSSLGHFVSSPSSVLYFLLTILVSIFENWASAFSASFSFHYVEHEQTILFDIWNHIRFFSAISSLLYVCWSNVGDILMWTMRSNWMSNVSSTECENEIQTRRERVKCECTRITTTLIIHSRNQRGFCGVGKLFSQQLSDENRIFAMMRRRETENLQNLKSQQFAI